MFEDSGEIYVITNKHNNKKYIGQAVCYLSSGKKWGSYKRWNKHISQANTNKCECRALENAIKKYGKESFYINVIIECGIHELNYFEDKYIKEYNTMCPYGYNIMSGGGNGRLHSIETRRRMSNTRIGKNHTQITKDKISLANKNKKINNETRIKISKTSRYRNMKEKNKETIDKLLCEKSIESLPIYINYITNKKTNSDGFIVRIPSFPYKKFMSKSITLSQKYDLANEYKNKLSNQRLSV